MKAMNEYANQDKLKAFNKGWGRSLACTLHFLRYHSNIELEEGGKEKLIDYMQKNRLRQFKSRKSKGKRITQ